MTPPSPLKTTTIPLNDGQSTSATQKLFAAIMWAAFIGIWLFSVSSPFLFFIFLALEFYGMSAFIAFGTVVAYAPWEKNAVTNRIHNFLAEHVPYHFQSVNVIVEGELPEDPKAPPTFFAIHPHGAFCMGWSILFCHKMMEHVRFCFAPFLYASPFFRIFCRITGKPGSASRESMKSYMSKGESVALPPGGFEEATLSCTTKDRVFIKKRTGFIKLCLQQGTAVRPVYVFGEKSVYWNIQGMWSLRLAVNRYGLPMILVWGHPIFALVPKNTVPLTIVIGSPLALPKLEGKDLTKEAVTMWHDKYMVALTRMFEDHKEVAYGPEVAKTAKLELW